MTVEMVRAVVQLGPQRFEIREFPKPPTGPDDGLLRVEACGICGSDVEWYKNGAPHRDAPPTIPGHEVLGIVEEVGERAAVRWGVQPGDRVALEIMLPCHFCERCIVGQYHACPNRRGGYGSFVPIDREPALWGGYAEYVYLHPDTIMHKVRNDLPAELAVMFNPLGAGVRWAADLGGTRLGDTVLVLGPGQRGISAVIAAKAAGAATVIVTGLSRDAHKLELAKEFGADHVIDVDKESTVEVVREITHGAMANVVLELTPMAAQPVRDAIEAVAFGGRIVLAGGKGGRPLEVVTDRLFAKGVTVVGAYGVDYRAYAQAINIIESGRLPLERLHTHTFGLADAALAVQTLAGETGESAMHVSISPEK